jgi:DNA-binding transcriptional ArsR family regulator
MLKSIITSETRIKLLLKFFLNPKTSGYLRQLAKEFNESTNSIRVELNKLSEARILCARREGRQKLFRANTDHPLFEDIRSIVLKSTGINLVVSNIIDNIGNLNMAFVRGDYAVGIDSGLIDLVLVGESLNKPEIERVRLKTEALIKRKISILVLSDTEYKSLENNFNHLPKLMLFQ